MKEKFKNSCPKMALIGLLAVAITFLLSAGSALAHEADPHPHAEDSKVEDTKMEVSVFRYEYSSFNFCFCVFSY
jgi:hypothetical protein